MRNDLSSVLIFLFYFLIIIIMCKVLLSQNSGNYGVNFRCDKSNVEKGIIVDIPEIEVDMLKNLPSEGIFDEINIYVKLKLNELSISNF